MWDRLTVLEKLGEGGMGEVLKVYDPSRHAVFAAKKLRPELARASDMKRFQREIENLRMMDHPNIVRIIDYSADPSTPGYLMELCEGGSIAEKSDDFAENLDRCGELILAVASALAYAHGLPNRVIHRDIKPANILIGANGDFKISDFGLSVQLGGEQERVTRSSNWISAGFSPPEQYNAFRDVDERADVYALGATVYYMYTGTFFSVGQPVSYAVEQPLRALLERCLHALPDLRFNDAIAIASFWRHERAQKELATSLSSFWDDLVEIAELMPYGAPPAEFKAASEWYDENFQSDGHNEGTAAMLDEFIGVLPDSFAERVRKMVILADKHISRDDFARMFFSTGESTILGRQIA